MDPKIRTIFVAGTVHIEMFLLLRDGGVRGHLRDTHFCCQSQRLVELSDFMREYSLTESLEFFMQPVCDCS